MTDLDQKWSEMLSAAIDRAMEGDQGDVADYLRLRVENDAIREAAVNWLFESMIAIAGFAVRNSSPVEIEREEKHRFTLRHSNLVGSVLRLRQGVRCLSLEAGWTRTPGDGFLRGGALAAGRITHFGMPKQNAEFRLVRMADEICWTLEQGLPLNADALAAHFSIFSQH
jgi:hypothetical protein